MLPEPGSAEDWLRYARSDLAVAQRSRAPDVLRETLCFHAQQAIEKSIKAVLVHHRIASPKTHSIARLIDLLPPSVCGPPAPLDSDQLTAYATALRYPAQGEPVTEDEFCRALHAAKAVLSWAEGVAGATPRDEM